jgi:hypothetical protein
VSADRPADAIARGDCQRRYDYQGRDILVHAHCVTSSNEDAFHHTVQLEITVDGRPYHQRDWSVSVPRKFV